MRMRTDPAKPSPRTARGAGRLSVDDAVALPQVDAWLRAKVDAMTAAPTIAQPVVESDVPDATDPEVAAVAVETAKLANTALTSSALPTMRGRARRSADRKAG
jgi:hypothetical protein